MNKSIDLIEALTHLVEDSKFQDISKVANRFNIFDAVGMTNQEIRHSAFLSFLLNPNNPHGLLGNILYNFLWEVFGDDTAEDLEYWCFRGVTVVREWNNIDILVRIPEEKVVLLIENKIWTGEHSDQLSRYFQIVSAHHPGWRIIPVYLTPGGIPPSDSRYYVVRYSTIVELVEGVSKRTDLCIEPDARVLLRHYTQLLRKNIVGGSELEILCQKIYLEHREAIDLINKYRPDTQNDMRRLIEELVNETEDVLSLVPIKPQTEPNLKKHCLFIPVTWDRLVPNSATGSDNWTTKICNFVVVNLPSEMYILLQLRPGSEIDRQRFYRIAESAGLVSGTRISKYAELRRWNLLTPTDYRNTTPSMLQEIIRNGWNDFVQEELPQITEVFRKHLTNN